MITRPGYRAVLIAFVLAFGFGCVPSARPDEICEIAAITGSDTSTSDAFSRDVEGGLDQAIVGAPENSSLFNAAGSAYILNLVDARTWVQTAELTASDAAAGDQFGNSVALDGDDAVVGATNDDDLGSDSGSVYMFHYSDDSGWTQQDKLTASDGSALAYFGGAVAILGDVTVVGARLARNNGIVTGAAYVFVRQNGDWVQHSKLLGSDSASLDEFGSAVAIVDDRILVGAPRKNGYIGAAYVFRLDGDVWVEEAKLTAADGASLDRFGGALDFDGVEAILGAENNDNPASNSGAAYVFVRTETTWAQVAKLAASDGTASDLFGGSVALSSDKAAIGATGANLGSASSGAVYLFENQDGNWLQVDKLNSVNAISGGALGTSAAILAEHVLVGAPDDFGTAEGSGTLFDFYFGVDIDCNGDSISDICDIKGGLSPDCNGNVIPDECDLAQGTSMDCSGNGVPDECEPDCNGNGQTDVCDILDGISRDCDGDGVPDECLAIKLLADDFESLVLDPAKWSVIDGVEVDHFGVNEPSGIHSLHLNGDPDGGDELDSVTFHLSTGQGVELSYSYERTGGLDSPETGDDLRVEFRDADGNWNLLIVHKGAGLDSTIFTSQTLSLPPEAHHDSFAFRFASTGSTDLFDDWFVDDVELRILGAEDCNGNGLPDDCDLAEGSSVDCSANEEPDDCEDDCNGNGVADSCDIEAGLSADCNGNEIPDACELAQRTVGDCDNDGLIDDCDVDGCLSRGITLLANVPPNEVGASEGNSVWGYVSPSGREYAIMGYDTGTAFFEVTDPANPDLVSYQPGPVSVWRDMKAYDHYAYCVSEGGQGIQVFDVGQIDNGVVTFLHNVITGGTTSTHTLSLDADSGYLYRGGGSQEGIRFYDLADPANPTYVGEWSVRYVHEAQIVTYFDGPYAGRQIAFCCGGTNTGYDLTGLYIVDVTNKAAPFQIAYYAYPLASYAHQGWLSPDRKYFYLDDEFDEDEHQLLTNTHVIQVDDLSNPIEVATFSTGSTSIDHNQYTLGRFIFQANYTSGLRVFDATDPILPVEIGFYDTYPADDSVVYDALWNNYPYLPSGIVLGSDISTGFYVWDVSTLRDCNGNGFDDGEDIALGASHDCNASRIPDECEFDDCNANCIPDYEEINVGAAVDDDGDGVPDECSTPPPCAGDANSDGVVDPLDTGFILSRFGCPLGTGDDFCEAANVNDDAIVDPLDVGYALSRLGECD